MIISLERFPNKRDWDEVDHADYGIFGIRIANIKSSGVLFFNTTPDDAEIHNRIWPHTILDSLRYLRRIPIFQNPAPSRVDSSFPFG